MTITIEGLEELESALSDIDAKPIKYSGRGMCGQQCLGVVGSFDEVLLGATIAKASENLSIPLLQTRRSRDHFGLGSVVYWPSIGYPEPVSLEQPKDQGLVSNHSDSAVDSGA